VGVNIGRKIYRLDYDVDAMKFVKCELQILRSSKTRNKRVMNNNEL